MIDTRKVSQTNLDKNWHLYQVSHQEGSKISILMRAEVYCKIYTDKRKLYLNNKAIEDILWWPND